jgi:serine/threonine protein kinase
MVDRRSDLYSLGIVFFHCLTGRVPFTADSPLSITVKHVNDPLPIEMLSSAQIPGPIIQVIQRMTAKRAGDRYQSADALVDALASALAASNIPLHRGWRGSMPLPAASQISAAPSEVMNPQATALPSQSVIDQGSLAVTITCFRCGSPNPSSRLYCTACGDELANKRAQNDRYLDAYRRPVLALLTIQEGAMRGRSYRFHQDVTTIGRTHGNDFIISGPTVSRKHARLWFNPNQAIWNLEDLQSANGTWVRGQRIDSAVVLNDGDIIKFGDEVVKFNITHGPAVTN